jgi:hypothetical protein
MTDILSTRPVSIEVDGRTISGTYSAWAGTITVTALGRTKRVEIGSMRTLWCVRMLLRQIVSEAQRRD